MTSRSPSTSVSELLRPRAVVGPLWALALIASVWRADDVRDWLGSSADPLLRFADVSGISALRAHSDGLRASLYGVREAPLAPPRRPTLHTYTQVQAAGSSTPAHQVTPRPRRVLLIGASSMQFAIGQAFEAQLAAYEGLSVRRVAKVSTGLSRPDGFNWPARLEELLAEEAPDLVIVNFGGNDAQNIPLPQHKRAEFGTAAWDAEYGARVSDFVERIRAHGARAVMIGMPIMRSPDFSERMRRLNRVTQAATLAAGGIYLDQWDLAAMPDGTYRELVEQGGKHRPMRMEDGIHYTTAGGRYVVARLLRRLEQKLRLVPKDVKLGVMERHTFHSAALGRQSSYLAWLPRLQAGERAPLLVLLHGADSSPDDLSEHVHAVLALAAAQHRIAIVAPDGGAHSWWLDSPERPHSRYASLVVRDLLADTAAHLPLTAARGISGISMGGHGALTLAFAHPDQFRSASSLSGVLDLTLAGDRPALVELLGPLATQAARWRAHSAVAQLERKPRIALRVSCGTQDRWIGANRALHQRAEQLSIPHTYDEAPAGHEWSYWEQSLPDHVAWHARALAAEH